MKLALITGITGQDGSYLAEFLLHKKYKVYGIIRRSSLINTKRIDHIYNNPNLLLLYGDVTESCNITGTLLRILKENGGIDNINCIEIYNLAAQSHVKVSFELPIYTANVDALGTLRLLEAVISCGLKDKVRFYQASTSELFGCSEPPQNEDTPFQPQSPYAVAKLYAYHIVNNYRNSYGLFACNGILFNHESEVRGETFLTRKITRGISSILDGTLEFITVGNLYAKRDWGYAKDYVEAMWLMLQVDTPEDYVIATNEQHSVKEFIETAFKCVDIDIEWRGEGLDEAGYHSQTNQLLIKIDKKYFRPTEVDNLLGDYSKAQRQLGWRPRTTFKDLVRKMVEHDCKQTK